MRIVGGAWGGRTIAAPPGRATRPTTDRVREAWMSAIAPELPGAQVVDLFAGSGALGLEALSRGAASATFVEQSPAAIRTLRTNLTALDVGHPRATVVRADALRFAERLEPLEYDVALADPPYGRGIAARLCEIFLARRFARLLCVEHAPTEALPVLEPLRRRRYGDTTLTFLGADYEA